jgi:hypothetical protein
VAKQKKMIRREHRKGAVRPKAPAAAPRPRQPVIARPHVLLEPVEAEGFAEQIEDVRADLPAVPGEGRGWHGSDEP